MTDAMVALAGMRERWYDRAEVLIDDRPEMQQSPEEIKTKILNGLRGGDEP